MAFAWRHRLRLPRISDWIRLADGTSSEENNRGDGGGIITALGAAAKAFEESRGVAHNSSDRCSVQGTGQTQSCFRSHADRVIHQPNTHFCFEATRHTARRHEDGFVINQGLSFARVCSEHSPLKPRHQREYMPKYAHPLLGSLHVFTAQRQSPTPRSGCVRFPFPSTVKRWTVSIKRYRPLLSVS